MRYTTKAFHTATANIITAGNTAERAKATWAILAAKGLQQGKLTLETVAESLIAAHCAADPEADKATTRLSHINPTTRGWYYDLSRVYEAGQIERVARGEALTTVRRESSVTEKGQNKSKPRTNTASGNKPKRLVSLNEAIAAVRNYLASARTNPEHENALAANSELAAMVKDISDMEKRVTARLEAAMAAEKLLARKTKATQATNRKLSAIEAKAKAKAEAEEKAMARTTRRRAKTTVKIVA